MYVCLLAGMFLLQGCFDLSERPYTSIRTDMFEASQEDLVAMIGSGYTPLRWIMGWHGLWDLVEESSDIMITPSRGSGWHDGGTYKRLHWHEWDINQSQPNNVWTNCFRGINRINLVLGQFDDGTLPVSEAELAPFRYELRALRALFYSIMLDTHGNVPIVTAFNDEIPVQSTRKEVYDFVISEMNAVIDNLSDEVGTVTYGRMNKWVAYSVLARVYLNAEVYTRAPGGAHKSGTPQWQACIDMCNKIIASGKYELEKNYRDVFKANNEGSKEIIFAVPYNEILTTGSGNFSAHMKSLIAEHRLVFNMQAQPWGGIAANPQFIDTYDPDDQRFDDTWLHGELRNMVSGEPIPAANDPNLQIAYSRKEIPSLLMATFYDGYRMGKYEIKLGTRDVLDNDFPYFRYADILMMKAECMMRLGDVDGAAAIVSTVRERSFANTNPAKAIVTGADLLADTKYQYGYYTIPDEPVGSPGWYNVTPNIDFAGTNQDPVEFGGFYDELGWEFACEARRRTDMIRFGTFQTKTWFNHRPNMDVGPENIILYIFGQSILNANDKLRQNPGYPDIARN